MSADPVSNLTETVLASEWATLKQVRFDFARRDGTSEPLVREVFDFGNGCGVLPYDPERGTVLLVRQFRVPPYLRGRGGFMIEVCAGLVGEETPEAAVKREAEEELGYRIRNVRHLFDGFSSPGAVAEIMSLFAADYSPADRISAGGGSPREGEDIEILEMPLADAFAMIGRGEIIDVKTILLLHHAVMTRR